MTQIGKTSNGVKDSIVQAGDPVLKTIAAPVQRKDIGGTKLASLIAKMSKTLAKEGFGVAIAAPQVGASLRVFLVAGKVFQPEDALEDAPTPADRVFINPEITRKSRSTKEMTEGCLSVRHKYGSVMRHEKASIKAWDAQGKPFVYHGSGLIAQIFQHEIDHLDGILYIDKAVTLKDDEDWKELKEKRAKNKQ